MRAILMLLMVVGLGAGCSKSKPSEATPPSGAVPPAKPEPPVKLVAGQPVGEPGGKVILSGQTFLRKNAADKNPPPGGVVTGTVVKSNSFTGVVEMQLIRLVPAGQTEWRYEIRPVGKSPLRLQAEKGAIDSLGVENDRGILFMATSDNNGKSKDPTTDYNAGLKWIDQPYEVFDTKGTKLPKSAP